MTITTKATWPEIIAALMIQPRTQREIQDYAGCCEQTVSSTLRILHQRGLVHRAGRQGKAMDEEGNHTSGRCPVLWAIQPKPFALADHD